MVTQPTVGEFLKHPTLYHAQHTKNTAIIGSFSLLPVHCQGKLTRSNNRNERGNINWKLPPSKTLLNQ